MDRAKLLDRVRKLYVMSQATESSPNEAEIAARRVNSLKEKYGITADELAESAFASLTANTARKSPGWLDPLMLAVALVNDCIVDKSRVGGVTSMTFKGFEQDVNLALMQFDYLVGQMDNAWRAYKLSKDGSAKGIVGTFKRGYANQMHDRLEVLANERRTVDESAPGQALIPMKMKMVTEEFGTGSKVYQTTNRSTNMDAYAAGEEAAKCTGINGSIT